MGNFASSTEPPGIKRNYENKKNVVKYSTNRIVQNFTLYWLDETIDVRKKDCQYTISELRKIVNSITLCTEANLCLNFIEKVREEQIFLIISGALGHKFVPLVHQFVRLDSIYIFCGDPSKHTEWTKKWPKIKLVANQIERICELMVKDASQCEYDLIPTSILSLIDDKSQALNRVNQSFMYSQLLKEILLEMNYDEKAMSTLIEFCRESFRKNEKELKIIDEFERDYRKYTPIWWYTRECFTYQMLNRSLRTVDIDIIAVMGFFMKDIYQQIKEEHSKRSNRKAIFIVYRGQGMMKHEFDAIQSSIGELFAFNSFLSTTVDLDVAMHFAHNRAKQSNKVPIVFEMEIDPTLTTTPFASLNNLSYYNRKEEEVLFSMHTVFRIIQIKESNDSIWRIKLKSVDDHDQQITQLTRQMRCEIGEGTAVDRLGRLMITVGEYTKAEAFYELLRETTSKNDRTVLACIYSQLGYIKYKQGKSSEAKSRYNDALEIQEKINPSTSLGLATTYNYIGLWYTSEKDSSNALVFHKKALAIQENCLDSKHPDIASTYNNIGLVYYQQKNFLSALLHFEKTCRIYESTLPTNHPWLATAYKNIGLVQISMGKQQDGLVNLHMALKIRQASLPANHPSIASVCSTIGETYQEIKDYSAAFKFFEQALSIEEKSSDSNPLSLAMVYYNLSTISNDLEKIDQALKYAKLAVDLMSKPEISNHPDAILFKTHYEKLKQNYS